MLSQHFRVLRDDCAATVSWAASLTAAGGRGTCSVDGCYIDRISLRCPEFHRATTLMMTPMEDLMSGCLSPCWSCHHVGKKLLVSNRRGGMPQRHGHLLTAIPPVCASSCFFTTAARTRSTAQNQLPGSQLVYRPAASHHCWNWSQHHNKFISYWIPRTTVILNASATMGQGQCLPA